MSRIEDLINELCPEGVERKRLEEVCNITRGRVMSKEYLIDNAGEYPVYSSQTTNNGIFGYIDNYDYDCESITWTTDGANAGSVFYHINEKFSITDVCGLLRVLDPSQVNTRFLYYCLQIRAKDYVNSGMGNPKLMSNTMARVVIPVPPLAVQQEIVRILDTFTELTTELTTRKKQYEFYRNQLLTFGDNVPRVPLAKVCISLNKGTLTQNMLSDAFEYPVMNSGRDYYGRFSEYNNEGNAFTIASRGEYAGFLSYHSGKFWAGGLCYPYRSKNENKVQTKYIFYVLKNSESKIMDCLVARGSIPALNKADIDKFLIPVPPLAVQERIVSILDKFDALVNSISEGLPAEIAARRQQYEYYRDQLLSFKRKGGVMWEKA